MEYEAIPRVRYYVTHLHLSAILVSRPLHDNRGTTRNAKPARMAPPNDRTSILASLRKTIDNGQLIVGAGAGIGLSAKFIEQGGGDLIIIYNSGRYRMAGRGSLAGLMPYGNANDVVLEMVRSYSSLSLCPQA